MLRRVEICRKSFSHPFDSSLVLLLLMLSLIKMCNPYTPVCSKVCRVTGSDDDCWQNNLQFFSDQLIQAVYNLTSIINHIEAYKTWHDGTSDGIKSNEYKRAFNQSINKDTGHLSSEDLHQIFNVILSTVWDTANSTDYQELPYKCPLPLDYPNKMWSWLAIVCMIISFLVTVSILLYAESLRRESRQLRLMYYQSAVDWHTASARELRTIGKPGTWRKFSSSCR